MGKTIVITGGAGFIGSNYIEYVLNAHPDYHIICVDKLTYAGNVSTISRFQVYQQFAFVQADICDRETLTLLFKNEKPEIVVNFAAESHVDRSIHSAKNFLHSNVEGTVTLLELCHQFGVERYHQVSTDEVYGDLPYDNLNLSFTEGSPIHANNPYSSSKASADIFALAYNHTYGVPVSISRCSNNLGPYQYPEKLIPLMIIRALQNKPLPVYGNGNNIRDWIHVSDHCSAIDKIVHKGRTGEVYNVGANNEMKNIDIVKFICRELKKPESLIEYVEDRKGHDRRYSIDAAKIRAELGWFPEVDFQHGLKSTIDWYKRNADWWQPLID